jgi:luciferase family oxidoreductase group 1
MSTATPLLYSILDLAPIRVGSNAAEAFRYAVDLAQHAERFGYHRFWLAEHHSMPGVASAATSVIIGHVAGATKTIRVGAGGIMLPNHSPLVIAEQFGTLESLYPGRIDLGLGRAPGSDQRTAKALRRRMGNTDDTFAADVRELQSYFRPSPGEHAVSAVPGEGLDIPIYILGSSDFGAMLAAQLGLPFAFASHFAPDYLLIALDLYRKNFKPSAQLDKPHAMIGVNVFAADTDAEAERLFTSLQQLFLNLIRGVPRQLAPPVDSMEGSWSPQEQAKVTRMSQVSLVGSKETIRQQLKSLIDETGADEIIATSQIFDHAARIRSFEIAADVFGTFARS